MIEGQLGGTSAEADRGRNEPRRWRRVSGLPLLLGLYGLVLFVYRPLSPFEWDEILFMRAMERFDIAAHSPHPPGYPVYVGMAKPFHWLGADAQLALQLVAMIGAVAALCLLWLLARRLGATRAEATCAAALLAATPAFVFNANVGMSDTLGTAGALAGVLALLAAWDRPERLPLAAAICGVALGVRPQVGEALLPFAAVVAGHAARAGRWRSLGGAAAAGVGASLACWLPAVLLTGPARFLGALRGQFRWIMEVDHSGQFSQASFGTLADRWLVAPFGSLGLALPFWCLVVVGAILHWRAGRRRLVTVCLAAGGGYLVLAMWTLHIAPSVRYVLPAVPFLALLAGGIAAVGGRVASRLAVAAVAGWCLVALTIVAGPALDVRRRRPAPVAEAMDWISTNFKPERTTVVYTGGLRPHVTLVLARRGFKVLAGEPGQRGLRELQTDGDVLLLSTQPVAGSEILFAPHWEVPQLSRLSRRMYDRCVVARAPATADPSVTADPLVAAVTADAIAAAPRGDDLLVPAAAHAWGKLGSFWTTDLVLCNTDPAKALTVELSVIGRPGSSAGTAVATRQVAPGGMQALPDVLSESLSFKGQAAIRLRSTQPFAAFWRTFDRKRAGADSTPLLLPALPSATAVERAAFDLGPVWPASGDARCNVGFVNLGGKAAEVEITVASGKAVTTRRVRVPAASSVQVDDIVKATAARPLRAEFRASSRLLAYAAVVETATGRVAYLVVP